MVNNSKAVIALLATNNYIALNRDVIKALKDTVSAALLCELCSEYVYWSKKKQLTEDGYFFSTVENIENTLFIKRKKQENIIKELKQLGLIETKLIGVPAKRHIKINPEKILEITNIVEDEIFDTDEMSEQDRIKADNKISHSDRTKYPTNNSNCYISNTSNNNNNSNCYISHSNNNLIGTIVKNNNRTRKIFKKPSVEDIEDYISENDFGGTYGVDAQNFYDYYESNGWKIGRNSMKDWKATVRNWFRNAQKNKPKGSFW